MQYYSTRDRSQIADEKEAIFRGPAPDGGLYVPETLPKFSYADFLDAPYPALAAVVLAQFFPAFDYDALSFWTQAAYGDFRTPGVVGFCDLGECTVAELFHGPTAAFKDFALQMLPRLMSASAEGRRVRILTATSGDTGKAALAGFQDVENTDIFVFYPAGGVSPMQMRQMATQQGKNVHVYAVRGNFDDAQRTVKEIFADEGIRRRGEEAGIAFSSANSINIGRLVPQIVYYIYSYLELVRRGTIEMGEKVDVAVPTGNFGNILAAMYAKEMSLPIGDFICASNRNNVLTDFIRTGVYDANRPFYKTTSPSMDILVASNIERYLHRILGRDYKIRERIDALKEAGKYSVPIDAIRRSKLVGYWSGDAEAEARIREVFERDGYLMDPHTAVAYDGMKKHGAARHVLVMATASPYKFPDTVARALGIGEDDERAQLEKIEALSGVPIPAPLAAVFDLPLRFEDTIDVEEMRTVVQEGFYD